MSSLSATTYKPLTYDGTGTPPLPVELWQEIFLFAFALVVTPANIEHELQSTIQETTSAFCGSPSIISERQELQRPKLYSLRRSIVLVCKDWHFIGISALYSHIYVDFNGPTEKIKSLSRALKANPRFASSIIRLSIKGEEDYQVLINTDGSLRLKNRLLEKIVAQLPSLQILTCPFNTEARFHSSLGPQVAIICHKSQKQDHPSYDLLSTGQHFWAHITTLSITYPGPPWISSIPEEVPIIPNLVNLHLNISEYAASKWIAYNWDLPSLRRLSVSSPKPVMWVRFIKKVAHNLESLEILLAPGFHDMYYKHRLPEPLTLPRLHSLCMTYPFEATTRDPVQSWIDHIVAPVLSQFTFHVQTFLTSNGRSEHFGGEINVVLQSYRTVKVLGVCYQEGKSHHWWSIDHEFPILDLSDIMDWCDRGLVVEVFQEGGKDKKVYSNHNRGKWVY